MPHAAGLGAPSEVTASEGPPKAVPHRVAGKRPGHWQTTIDLLWARPVLNPAQSSGRVNLLDAARGLLVVWMIIAHALTVAAVPRTDLMQYLRPPGWATTCFIMLTGFTVAVLFRWTSSAQTKTSSKLWRRAFRLGVIAFLSNVIFKACQAWVQRSLSWDFLRRVVTFQEPWSISAFLIPTTLFLAISPALFWIAARIGPRILFLAATVLPSLFRAAVHLPVGRVGTAGVFEGQIANGFSWVQICSFVLYGIWGYALGCFMKSEPDLRQIWSVLLIGSVGLLVFVPYFIPPSDLLAQFAMSASRFLTVLYLVSLLLCISSSSGIPEFLMTLGRSALLVFLVHRPAIQACGLILHGMLPDRALALELMLITLVGGFWLASMRNRSWQLSAVLHGMGL